MRLLPFFLLAGCAQVQRSLPIEDLLQPQGELSPDVDASTPNDLSGFDASAGDLTGGLGDMASCLGMVKINEVQTGGSASLSDEWIELYNPCAAAVDLTGAKLTYRAATNVGASDSSTVAPLTGNIPAGGYYLVANTNYSGAPTPNIKPFAGSGLLATGGAVGLRDSVGTLIDSVGWGSANNPFVEAAVAVAPAAGKSIARQPNGTDSNNNKNDFVQGTPTPKAAN